MIQFRRGFFLEKEGVRGEGRMKKEGAEGSKSPHFTSGVFPYPNGSCKKIGFHIELQMNAIGIGWFLLAIPPKNRTCEFHHIRLKCRRFKDAQSKQAKTTISQRKPW
jgi:hypothetical protein